MDFFAISQTAKMIGNVAIYNIRNQKRFQIYVIRQISCVTCNSTKKTGYVPDVCVWVFHMCGCCLFEISSKLCDMHCSSSRLLKLLPLGATLPGSRVKSRRCEKYCFAISQTANIIENVAIYTVFRC